MGPILATSSLITAQKIECGDALVSAAYGIKRVMTD
jgi:hypothetical protein